MKKVSGLTLLENENIAIKNLVVSIIRRAND